MPEMVLLRHETPDGTWHYDWLIDPGGGAALVSFRLKDRLDESLPGVADGALEASSGTEREFPAERIDDHRRVYLDYEGELSGGRGWVRRVARGFWRRFEATPEAVTVDGELGGTRGRFEAWRESGDRWVVRVVRANGAV